MNLVLVPLDDSQRSPTKDGQMIEFNPEKLMQAAHGVESCCNIEKFMIFISKTWIHVMQLRSIWSIIGPSFYCGGVVGKY